MSVIRISRPGHETELIPLGPAVGRRTFTRYATVGGAIVTPAVRKRAPVTDERKAHVREYARRYWEANRDAMNAKQRTYRASKREP